MSAYLDINGSFVADCRVTIPATGAWVADVTILDDATIPSSCTLTLGNLVLRGTLLRDGLFAGQRRLRIVGGAAGWGKTVPARAYATPGGIPLALLLTDLAAETGERFAPAPPSVVGQFFTRSAAPAQRVLRQLVGELWWIDAAGLTHVEPRPAGVRIGSDFQVVDYDGGRGYLEVATDDLAAWVPGAVVAGVFLTAPVTLASVSIVARGDDLRVEALVQEIGATKDADRAMSSLRRLIRAELATLTFLGTWEYQVTTARVSSNVVLLEGRPLAPGMPPVAGVPFRTPIPGSVVMPAPGSKVLVGFVNGDPSRPFAWPVFDETNADGITLTRATDLLEPGAEVGRVVRYGDPVQLPVAGALAAGAIIQQATSAPNAISRVVA